MDENANKNTSFYRKNVNTHLFSSFLICSHCGKGMNANLDAPRKDGFTPSIYRCQSRLNKMPCTSTKIGTDVRIAPFVLQLVSNMLKYKDKKQILNAKVFKDVKDLVIEKPVYDESEEYILDGNVKTDYEHILKENEKHKRALERLDNLYLYSEDAMSEKDYLIKKLEIQSKIKEVKPPDKINDEAFIKVASYFILNNELLSKKNVNYKEIAKIIDKNLLKEFLNKIIDKIEIDNNKVSSVRFANGMVYRFIY